MRHRKVAGDHKRVVRLDIELTPETLQHYVDICQCPFCQDGRIYRMLPGHIYQVHGITAYQLREDVGWDRGHRLTSPETTQLMAEKAGRPEQVRRFLSHPRWGDGTTRYADGGKRAESLARMSARAKQPEAQRIFQNTMGKVDRREIAIRVPPEIRSTRSQRTAQTCKRRYGSDYFRRLGHKAGKASVESHRLIPAAIRAKWRRKAVKTTKERHGESFYHRIGKRGGMTVKEQYGHDYYHNIGKMSVEARARKHDGHNGEV